MIDHWYGITCNDCYLAGEIRETAASAWEAVKREGWHKAGGSHFCPGCIKKRGGSKAPCPEGFHWIGQQWSTCDKCALPAWEHAGIATPDRTMNTPFSNVSWVLRPWAPGQREEIERFWARRA